jgi:hypothetical protein
MFHSYNNNPNYGYLGVQSVFKPFKAPEVEYVEETTMQTPVVITKKKYLPGERLLKKLNKQQQKKKPNICMDTIHQSISEILEDLSP